MRHIFTVAVVFMACFSADTKLWVWAQSPPSDLVRPKETAKPAILTFEQLREGVRRRYRDITALEVHYRQIVRNINVDLRAHPEMDYHFALKGEKRFCSQSRVVNGEPSLSGAVTLAFDESTEQTFSPEPRTGSITPPAEKSAFIDMDAYVNSLAIVSTDRERAEVTSTAYSLPYALDVADNEWKVQPTIAIVDGSECHVLESKYRQRIWIDPALGFAVRFREMYQNITERPKETWPLAHRYSYRDFQKMSDTIWLPRVVDIVAYVSAKEPEGRWNLPGWSTSIHVKKLAVNDRVSDRLFKISFPPGTTVIDDIHNRFYFVGDANEELDITVSKERDRFPTSRTRHLSWLLVVNAILVVMIAVAIGYRYLRRKHSMS